MLVLTYLTEHNDGFGSQYQRILGIYSICKELDICIIILQFLILNTKD